LKSQEVQNDFNQEAIFEALYRW